MTILDLNKTTLNELLNAEYTPVDNRTGINVAHHDSMTRHTIGSSGKMSPHVSTPVLQHHLLKPSAFASNKIGETSSHHQMYRERPISGNLFNATANIGASNTAQYSTARTGSADANRANLDALFRDLRFREHYMNSRGSNAPSITSASTDRLVHSSIDENESSEKARWFRTGRRRH